MILAMILNVFYNRFNLHNFSQELAAFKNVSFEQKKCFLHFLQSAPKPPRFQSALKRPCFQSAPKPPRFQSAPGQQSPQDIFFGGGLPAHGVPWSAMAHGDPRSDMAAWVPWSAVGPGTGNCPGGHQSCLHDPWGHQEMPTPPPIGCCTVRDAGGPVSPCLVTPFLKCPYMVLPVSCSLLVQLVPAVCLDCVPGI